MFWLFFFWHSFFIELLEWLAFNFLYGWRFFWALHISSSDNSHWFCSRDIFSHRGGDIWRHSDFRRTIVRSDIGRNIQYHFRWLIYISNQSITCNTHNNSITGGNHSMFFTRDTKKILVLGIEVKIKLILDILKIGWLIYIS